MINKAQHKHIGLIEAAAFDALWLLDYKELKEISSFWLETLPYSDVLFEVYTDSTFANNSSTFKELLEERNIKIPSQDEAIDILLKLYIKMIAEGNCDPYEGMVFIVDTLTRQKAIEQYEELEHMYTWYLELRYAKVGTTEETIKEFKRNLQEEAKKLIETKPK